MLLSWQNEFWRSVDLDFKKVPQRRLCKIASSILKLCIFIKIEILGIYFKFQIRAQYQKWYLDIYILKYCFKRFLFDNLTLIFILFNLNFWVIVLCSPCWSWTHYELKSGLGLLILLPSAPRWWDNKFVSPSMALSFNLNFYVIHIIIKRF